MNRPRRKILPAVKGLKVRNPDTKRHLPEDGEAVNVSSYWIRRAAEGDIVFADTLDGRAAAVGVTRENNQGDADYLAAIVLAETAADTVRAGGGTPNAEAILAAVRKLDPENDRHWTGGGLPSLAIVSGEIGVKITREDIAAAAPGFDREQARASAQA